MKSTDRQLSQHLLVVTAEAPPQPDELVADGEAVVIQDELENTYQRR